MSNITPIRVIIADDHAMVRVGLSTILDSFSDMQLVAEANNGTEAIELCKTLHPDVILMDVKMPGMDGIQATQQIKSRFPEVQVIVITSYDETNLVNKALQAGAIGYLLKNVSATELGNAIRNAKMNKPTLAPEATQALIHATTHDNMPEFDITDRELDVLRFMVKGLSNAEIAQQLQISRFTVKNHISSIFSKLNVASRTEASTLAIQHHLVELE